MISNHSNTAPANSPAAPIDLEARNLAIDVSHSYAVSAPAGSGKTGLLTLRVLKLLARVKNPEEILSITFTRKAAQEMRERILGALREVKPLTLEDIEKLPDPHEKEKMQLAYKAHQRDQELSWNLEHLPYRLRILTIDGLCRAINNQLPITSQTGAEPNILSDPKEVYEHAVDDYITDGLQKSDEHLLVLIKHFDCNIDKMANMLVSLLGTRDQWLPLVLETHNNQEAVKAYLEASLSQWASDLVESTKESLGIFEGELCELAHYASQQLIAEGETSLIRLMGDYDGFPNSDEKSVTEFWSPLAELFLTASGEYRKSLTKKVGFPAGKTKDEKAFAKERKSQMQSLIGEVKQIPELSANLVAIKNLPAQTYDPQQWHTLAALISVLTRLIAYLRLAFGATESTDFIEITQATLLGLSTENKVEDITLKLDYQLQHILVDEFQDTSSTQIQLLEKLTQGWFEGDGKTLFVVGDGMQSCYGFRNANVGIFLDLRKNGLQQTAVTALNLEENFRSTKTIVGWVNQVFQFAFPPVEDIARGAVTYSPSHAFKTQYATESTAVECCYFAGAEDRFAEAAYMRDEIRQYRQQYPDDSVAILVKSRAHLAPIIDLLKQAQIDFEAVEIDPLAEKQWVVDLLSLTKALHDHSDKLSWVALLRSPWCGLNLQGLYTMVHGRALAQDHSDGNRAAQPSLWENIGDSDLVEGLDPDAKQRLIRFRNTMGKAVTCFRRSELALIIEAAWMALGGPQTLPSDSALQDISTFISLVREHEIGGKINDWRSFSTALDKLYAKPKSETDAGVQLMTMHKSKGLEFDTVFLPSLDRNTRGDDPSVLYWLERINRFGEKNFLLSPIGSDEYATSDQLSSFIKEEQKIKRALEDTRLLYVACTRAKKRLHLSANLDLDDEDQPKAPSKGSLLSKIWPQTKADFIRKSSLAAEPSEFSQDDAARIKTSDTLTPTEHFQVLKADWRPPSFASRHQTFRAPSAYIPDYATDGGPTNPESKSNIFDNTGLDVFEELGKQNLNERAEGIIFHRVLARLGEKGLASWDKTEIDRMQPFWQTQLTQQGVRREDIEGILSRMSTALLAQIDNPTALWLFDRQHQDNFCELALFNGSSNSTLIVDRTFVSEGQRWLVDYKTSQPKAGQSLESFVEQEKDQYKAQLVNYAAALNRYFQGSAPGQSSSAPVLNALDKQANMETSEGQQALDFGPSSSDLLSNPYLENNGTRRPLTRDGSAKSPKPLAVGVSKMALYFPYIQHLAVY